MKLNIILPIIFCFIILFIIIVICFLCKIDRIFHQKREFFNDHILNLKYIKNIPHWKYSINNGKTYVSGKSKIFNIKYNTKIFDEYIQKLNQQYPEDYGIFFNTIVTTNGEIIKCSKSKFFLNGPCHLDHFHENDENTSIKIYNKIISITEMWGYGIWHFPYECMVALKTIPQNILKNTKIHVSEPNIDYIKEWLALININASQVVTGTIYGKQIYFPKMGDGCGEPSLEQILWIQNIFNKHITTQCIEPNYVIIIKRTKSRLIDNYNELQEYVENFTKKHKLKLYIHDDSNLPSIKDQINIFNKAKYVFANHGAAGVFIPALKKNTWFIELFPGGYVQGSYKYLANKLHINYIDFKSKTNDINIAEFNNKIEKLL